MIQGGVNESFPGEVTCEYLNSTTSVRCACEILNWMIDYYYRYSVVGHYVALSFLKSG